MTAAMLSLCMIRTPCSVSDQRESHRESFPVNARNSSSNNALSQIMHAALYIVSTVTLVTFMFGIGTLALIFYNNRKG